MAGRVQIETTPIASERLTPQECERAVQRAVQDARGLGIQPGQSYRLNFTKAGKGYTVAVDCSADGLGVKIGLPQELLFEEGGGKG